MESATAKANGAGKRWTKDESMRLLKFYPEHGLSWDGWKTMLPDKTRKSILNKAIRMGLKRRKKHPKKKEIVKVNSTVNFNPPDPYEDVVIAYMSAGFPPSEIDERMGWFRGSAGLIMSNMWKRETVKK